MSLETATYISQLDVTNPLGSDPIASGDDHLRLIKSTLKNTFPNITGVVSKSHTEINNLASLSDLSTLETTLNAAIASAVAATKTALYPVGSIYTNASNNTNPGTLLGFGTWTAFGAGRMPVGYDSTNALFSTAESTGGSYDAVVVTHTHAPIVTDPGHTHTWDAWQSVYDGLDSTVLGGSAPTLKANTSSSTTGITVNNSNAASTTTYTVTISIATPGVLTFSGSAPANGTKVVLSTTGALPTGLVAGTEYYVVNSTGSTCQLSSSLGGAAINTSGTQSGTHKAFILTGVSATNANLPPYITVYMWKRTA
jgi:hypothetical protein